MSNGGKAQVQLSLDELYSISFDTLTRLGLATDHAETIARNLWLCQRDECQSHGLYRLLSSSKAVIEKAVVLDAVPVVIDHAPAIVRVDAKGGFSLLAFEKGKDLLIEKARHSGIAAMAINNCVHFSALWPDIEALTEQGLVAMAMLPSHAWVAPAGGKQGVFGTNPFAFGWPRKNVHPMVFDFATSASARGEIELYLRAGKELPEGWAVDSEGKPTTDPQTALDGAMLTFGGHKGSAIAMMIELMAGPLIGDLLSLEAMADTVNSSAAPRHGEIIIAFNPDSFLGAQTEQHMERAEMLFDAIAGQGARIPSQRRYEARARSDDNQYVTVPQKLYEDIQALSAHFIR
ncbi:Ldh family oxidoreductase [Paenochrobactrum sp. BZR 588]|uniref:Ldh family oxidoreductase n=1 Tax=unclassified Paenochrobactrum TaxID=2639760 RepID=UPI003853C5BB